MCFGFLTNLFTVHACNMFTQIANGLKWLFPFYSVQPSNFSTGVETAALDTQAQLCAHIPSLYLRYTTWPWLLQSSRIYCWFSWCLPPVSYLNMWSVEHELPGHTCYERYYYNQTKWHILASTIPENCRLVEVFLRKISGECDTQWFLLFNSFSSCLAILAEVRGRKERKNEVRRLTICLF